MRLSHAHSSIPEIAGVEGDGPARDVGFDRSLVDCSLCAGRAPADGAFDHPVLAHLVADAASQPEAVEDVVPPVVPAGRADDGFDKGRWSAFFEEIGRAKAVDLKAGTAPFDRGAEELDLVVIRVAAQVQDPAQDEVVGEAVAELEGGAKGRVAVFALGSLAIDEPLLLDELVARPEAKAEQKALASSIKGVGGERQREQEGEQRQGALHDEAPFRS